MKNLGRSFLFVLPLILLSPFTAHADVQDILNSDNAIDIDFGASQLSYGEQADAQTLDTEKGWMPAFGLGAGYVTSNTHNPWTDNIFFRLDGRGSIGDTHYNGALCSIFGCTPAQSTTHSQVYTVQGKVGRAIPLDDFVMVTPFVDLGYRFWRRSLTGIGGYNENYSDGNAMGGFMVQVSPLPKWVLSLSGEGGTDISPSMQTGGQTYKLQQTAMYEASGKIGYEFSPRLEATGTAEYSGFGFGMSNNVAGSYEPTSYTHQLVMLVGLAYHFQEPLTQTKTSLYATPSAPSRTSSVTGTYATGAQNVVPPSTASTAATTGTYPSPYVSSYAVAPRSNANGF